MARKKTGKTVVTNTRLPKVVLDLLLEIRATEDGDGDIDECVAADLVSLNWKELRELLPAEKPVAVTIQLTGSEARRIANATKDSCLDASLQKKILESLTTK